MQMVIASSKRVTLQNRLHLNAHFTISCSAKQLADKNNYIVGSVVQLFTNEPLSVLII